MKKISWKNQEKAHEKELEHNQKKFLKKKRETVQVRLVKKYHEILKEEARDEEVTLSKLLEQIVKDYVSNVIIEKPDSKLNNLKAEEDNGNLLSGDI